MKAQLDRLGRGVDILYASFGRGGGCRLHRAVDCCTSATHLSSRRESRYFSHCRLSSQRFDAGTRFMPCGARPRLALDPWHNFMLDALPQYLLHFNFLELLLPKSDLFSTPNFSSQHDHLHCPLRKMGMCCLTRMTALPACRCLLVADLSA